MPRGMGRGRGPVEKPLNFGGAMKKLVRFCRRYIPVIVVSLILGAAGTICQIIGPDKLKDMTNEITKGLPAIVHGKPVMNSIDMDAVSRIGWTLVALYVGYAVLCYVQSWLMANVTQRTAQQLREAISVKINKLPLKYFDKVSYGDVLSRITNDVDAIGQTLGQSLGSLITSITLFFGAPRSTSPGSRWRWVTSTATWRRCTPVTSSSRHTTARPIRFVASRSTTRTSTSPAGSRSSSPA